MAYNGKSQNALTAAAAARTLRTTGRQMLMWAAVALVAGAALLHSIITVAIYRPPLEIANQTNIVTANETITNWLTVNNMQCVGPPLPDTCLPPVGTFGGDVVGPLIELTVVGLQTVPLAEASPALGQLLGYDGAAWGPVTPSPIVSLPGSNIIINTTTNETEIATTRGVVFDSLAVTESTLLGTNTSCVVPLLPSCYDISSQSCPSGPLAANCVPLDMMFNNLLVHNLTLFNATTLDVPIGNQSAIYVDYLWVQQHQYLSAPLTCPSGGSIDSACLHLGNYSCPLGSPLADSCIPASLVQYDQTVTHELTVNLVTCTGPPLPLSCLPPLTLVGDVEGTLGVSSTVVALQSVPLAPAAPSDTQLLTFNGSHWLPASLVAGANVVLTPVGSGTGATEIATAASVSFSDVSVSGTTVLGTLTTCAAALEAVCIPTDLSIDNLMVHNLTLVNVDTLNVAIGNQTIIYTDDLVVSGALTCVGPPH